MGKAGRIVGLVLHLLIGLLLVFSGGMKLVGPEMADDKAHLVPGIADSIQIIAVGEIITGVLLIVPLTSSLGVLLTSAFFGGTIVFHMGRQEPYVFQSTLLVLTWIGGFLRNPGMLGSFARSGSWVG